MNKSLLWLAAPLTMAFLVGCEPLPEDGESENSEGSGSGSSNTTDGTDSSSVGLPSFTGFSLQGKGETDAQFTTAPTADLAQETDGKSVSFMVHADDRHSHPVKDGTVVQFKAEFGIITSSCETENGTCTVSWVSGGDRPLDKKVTVLAYTKGEDSYIESGISNGLFDVNEPFISTPEAFLDLNFDQYTSGSFVDSGTGKTITNGDPYLDFNGNSAYDLSSSKFRGVDCSTAAVSAGHCASSEVWVWDQIELTLTP